jgi:hypothetical protein
MIAGSQDHPVEVLRSREDANGVASKHVLESRWMRVGG